MSTTVLVNTSFGPIVGFRDTFPVFQIPSFIKISNGEQGGEPPVTKWLGIPYAKAGRWQRPRPPVSWISPLRCSEFGSRFPQPLTVVDLIFGGKDGLSERPSSQSEDFGFNLNVFTPPDCHVTDHLPVMVWIYGGSLEGGSSESAIYDPTEWIRRESLQGRHFIVVTGNYRCGIFGFMSCEDLAEEDPEGLAGNYGAYDCIAILQWVQDNIGNFGGDPNNVTIFGESAGAFLIGALLVTQQKLFKSAIMQSGCPESLTHRDVGASLNKALYQSLLDHFNVPKELTGKERIQFLRDIPTSEIMDFIFARGPVVNDYGLAIESSSSKAAVWPKPAIELIKERKWNPSLESVLMGHNKDEGSIFAYFFQTPTKSGYESVLTNRCPSAPREKIDNLYPPVDTTPACTTPIIMDWKNCAGSRLVADQLFEGPMENLAMALEGVKHCQTGKVCKVFAYQLNETIPSIDQGLDWGAFHTIDLPLLFNVKTLWSPESDQAKSSATMGRLWVNFARTGCPDPSWPEYAPSTSPLKLFIEKGGETHIKDVRKIRSDVDKRRIQFWIDELPEIVTFRKLGIAT